MSRRVLAEIAIFLLWMVGGSAALLAAVPRMDAAATAVTEQQQEDLLADLNAFRLLSGANVLALDRRLSDLVAVNSAGSIGLPALLERQALLCEESDWVSVQAPTHESLLAALSRAGANRTPAAAAVRRLQYTHVGLSALPDPDGSGAVYRLLLCSARQPLAHGAEVRHARVSARGPAG